MFIKNNTLLKYSTEEQMATDGSGTQREEKASICSSPGEMDQ